MSRREKLEGWLPVLKEVQTEYPVNTNLDTIIRSIESQIKELKNK